MAHVNVTLVLSAGHFSWMTNSQIVTNGHVRLAYTVVTSID